MENPEEILLMLERFSKQKTREISPELSEYLASIARNGETIFRWPLVKPLVREKLLAVITDFHDTTPNIKDLPSYPNVDPFNYEQMKKILLDRLEMFEEAPFTIQRICELLTEPSKQYKRIDKFMRAIEKNILVVSTQEPGRRRQDSENGDQDSGLEWSEENGDLNVDNIEDLIIPAASVAAVVTEPSPSTTAPAEEASTSGETAGSGEKPAESNGTRTEPEEEEDKKESEPPKPQDEVAEETQPPPVAKEESPTTSSSPPPPPAAEPVPDSDLINSIIDTTKCPLDIIAPQVQLTEMEGEISVLKEGNDETAASPPEVVESATEAVVSEVETPTPTDEEEKEEEKTENPDSTPSDSTDSDEKNLEPAAVPDEPPSNKRNLDDEETEEKPEPIPDASTDANDDDSAATPKKQKVDEPPTLLDKEPEEEANKEPPIVEPIVEPTPTEPATVVPIEIPTSLALVPEVAEAAAIVSTADCVEMETTIAPPPATLPMPESTMQTDDDENLPAGAGEVMEVDESSIELMDQ